jgi:hypothetical protein
MTLTILMSKWRAEQSMLATKLDSFLYCGEWSAKIDGNENDYIAIYSSIDIST